MKKKVLLVAGTHGNEPIGPELLERLKQKQNINNKFESIIGNPRALKKNVRFTEVDLNRSAPGKENSPVYEIARAFELMKKFESFDYIIDLHETKANDRIVIIIPELSKKTLALALAFDIDQILIWPSSSLKSMAGPLVQSVPFGIEIESGTKTSFKDTLCKLENIVVDFLSSDVSKIKEGFSLNNIRNKQFYLVYERISQNQLNGVALEDFKEVKVGNEIFRPLLFGKHEGLKGYKMRQLTEDEIINIINGNKSIV